MVKGELRGVIDAEPGGIARVRGGLWRVALQLDQRAKEFIDLHLLLVVKQAFAKPGRNFLGRAAFGWFGRLA